MSDDTIALTNDPHISNHPIPQSTTTTTNTVVHPLLNANEVIVPNLPNDNNNNNDNGRIRQNNGRTTTETSNTKTGNKTAIVQWKVKHKSIVRIGERIAICVSSVSSREAHSSSSVDHHGEDTGSTNRLPPSNNSFSSSLSSLGTAKLIRPRKRSRGGVSLPPKANHKPAGESQSSSSSPSLAVPSSSSTACVTSVSSSSSSDSIAIRATHNGVLSIYNPPQTRRRRRQQRSTTVVSSHTTNHGDTTATAASEEEDDDEDEIVTVCGRIEPCTHPVVIDGLCAVCGFSVPNKSSSIPSPLPSSTDTTYSTINDYNVPSRITSTNPTTTNPNSTTNPNPTTTIQPKNSSFTVSHGITIDISSTEASDLTTQSTLKLHSSRKLNLVLDLDHTLLHATNDPRAVLWIHKCHDVRALLLPVPPVTGGTSRVSSSTTTRWPGFAKHYVKIRPGLAEFLSRAMERFEISIYTAATGVYAHKVADLLCRHVLDYTLAMERNQRWKDTKEKERGTNGNGIPTVEGEEPMVCLDEEDLLLLRHEVLAMEKKVKDRQDYIARLNEKLNERKSNNRNNGKIEFSTNGTSGSSGSSGTTPTEPSASKASKTGTASSPIHIDDSPIPKKRRVTFGNVSLSPEEPTTSPTTTTPKSPYTKLALLQKKLQHYETLEKRALELRKKIFHQRVVSRTDITDLGSDVKSLRRVFPCGGRLAAIVDDREDVWANANDNATGRRGEPPDNLLLVKPYRWKPFRTYADVNNAAGEDISKSGGGGEGKEQKKEDPTIEDDEVQLKWTYDILIRVHDRYYSDIVSDEERSRLTVPSILKQMRKDVFGKTLRTTKIIFSGLVPLHVQQNTRIGNSNHQLPRPPVVRYAEELGAEVTNDVTSEVTHIVAARDGTDKIKRARRIPGCAVVSAKWLMECFWSITRKDIRGYIIGTPPLPLPLPPPPKPKPQILLLLSGSDGSEEDGESSEEEDDAFFESFDKE